MANTLGVKRRIRSIKNIRQITKAMELVSATKMRRAQTQALRTRTYAALAWEMINSLSDKIQENLHRLLRRTPLPKSALVVVITSDRGLAGTFNNQIFTTATAYFEQLAQNFPGIKIDTVAVGKKGGEYLFKSRRNVVADFQKIDVNLRVEEILPLAQMLTKKYADGAYDLVSLIYTDFISTLSQKARIKQLLPLPTLKAAFRQAATDGLAKVTKEPKLPPKQALDVNFEYLFEPAADTVLEKLIPRLLEMQIYQAQLESNASEHSARMVAMKNASDAAADIISDLTLEYNQMRQAGITKEIAEISAGRLAVT